MKVFSSERLVELERGKQSLNERCKDLRSLRDAGTLSETELAEILARKQLLIRASEVEIEAHMKASNEAIMAGLKIIELLGKSYDFMQLEGKELDKMRLAKEVLSNPILADGNLRFDYRKPFDVLSELTGHRKWWT